MKNFKSSKAYGAFEYIFIIASAIIVGILILKSVFGKVKESSKKNLSPIESVAENLQKAIDSTKLLITLNISDQLIYEYNSNILNSDNLIKDDFKNYVFNDVLENKKLKLDNSISYNKGNYEVTDISLIHEESILIYIQFKLYDKNKGTTSDNITSRAVDTYIRKIYVDAHDSEDYSDEDGFSGKLEKYLYSGELIEEDTKFVTDYHQANYNVDEYVGILIEYVKSQEITRYKGNVVKPASDTRIYRYQGNVTKPTSIETKNHNMSHTIWAPSSPTPTSSFPSTTPFNDGTWSGTLSKTGSPSMGIWGNTSEYSYRAHGATSVSEAISMAKSYASSKGFNYYSTVSTTVWTGGGYDVTFKYQSRLWSQVYSGIVSRTIPAETKYVTGQTSASYDVNGFKGTLTQYVYSGNYTPSDTKFVTNQISSSYNNGGYVGILSPYETTISVIRYEGNVTKPEKDTRVYKYRGYVTR